MVYNLFNEQEYKKLYRNIKLKVVIFKDIGDHDEMKKFKDNIDLKYLVLKIKIIKVCK